MWWLASDSFVTRNPVRVSCPWFTSVISKSRSSSLPSSGTVNSWIRIPVPDPDVLRY
jgi:hypothetical protein